MASKKIFVLYGLVSTTFYTNKVLVKIIQIFGMRKKKRKNGILFAKRMIKMNLGRNNEIFELY